MGFWGTKKTKQEKSGFPGDCSTEQLKALQVLKKHVNETNPLNKQQYDDIYLLRFLRARKFDIEKTKKMWDNFIQWRVKNNIDNCRNFKFPTLPQLRHMYPHGYHKVDKEYRPIYIERVGFIDLDKVFDVMKTEDMLKYYALLYETLLTTIFDGCTKARMAAKGDNTRVTQTVTILDMKNVKLSNASKSYDFVKPVSAMAQDNYPQILGNMFIVNAPMLFTGIWQIVKMWIDEKTKDKIKILGSKYKKQLLEYIDPENLPDFLDGGKCRCHGKECLLEANVGPWNPEGKQMFEENIYGKKEEEKVQPQKIHKQSQMNVPSQSQNYKKQESKSVEPQPSVLLSGPPPQQLPDQSVKIENQPIENFKEETRTDLKNEQSVSRYQQQNEVVAEVKVQNKVEVHDQTVQDRLPQNQSDKQIKNMINKGAEKCDEKNPISDSQLPKPVQQGTQQEQKQRIKEQESKNQACEAKDQKTITEDEQKKEEGEKSQCKEVSQDKDQQKQESQQQPQQQTRQN